MSGPRQPDLTRWEQALRWLAYVDEDLRAAALLATDIDLAAVASFHCQQAAEKIAKAALVAFGENYPKIHDVGELGQRVAVLNPELGESLQELSGLTDWYIASRYPDLVFMPSQQDVQAVLATLRDLRQQIAALAPKPGE
jgi:HEPN domain-containing protein